jgi:hypothetical protein
MTRFQHLFSSTELPAQLTLPLRSRKKTADAMAVVGSLQPDRGGRLRRYGGLAIPHAAK